MAAFTDLCGYFLACDVFKCHNKFVYGHIDARTDVYAEKIVGSAADTFKCGVKVFGGKDICAGNVPDVDIITYTGAVTGILVVAGNYKGGVLAVEDAYKPADYV